MNKAILALLIALAPALIALPAEAALVKLKKIKKWPEEDRAWARSFDSWMTDEELGLLIKMKTTEERKSFLTELGYLKMWEDIEDEIKPHVIRGEVVIGMNQDEVYMCWDKPKKIRKDFKKTAYVNVLNYEFEVDRKGREFLLRPDSETAYKNEVITKFVYMHNGKVFAIVNQGEEEDVMDALPTEDAPESAPAEAEPKGEAGDEGPESKDETGAKTKADSTSD